MVKTYNSLFLLSYMNSRYIIYFFIILTIILFIGLYMFEIPSPSATITEKYNLNLK